MKDIIIPSEYSELLNSHWREAAVYGGRNSLKSHTVARVLLIRSMSKPGIGGCFREYQNSIADSSKSLLEQLIDEHKIPSYEITKDSIIYKPTGYKFIFRGLHNNIQSIKSIEGMTEAWIEEAQTVTEQSLDVLTPTVRLPGSQIIYTYNRLRDKDPVHNRIVIEGRPNSLIINCNYDVAIKYGWMSDSLLAEMEDDKEKRPEIYKHKWLGEPANLKGQIYNNWKKIDSIPTEAKYMGNGLDFGYTNHPTAIVNVFKWNNAYIVDEVVYKTGLKNPAIADILISNQKVYGSEITEADSAEPKSIAEIKDCGYQYIEGVIKGKDSKINGIQRLEEREIYYTARSHNIEEEVLNYVWKVDREDKSMNIAIDAYDHAMDAIRYKIMQLETHKAIDYSWSVH